MNNGTWYQGNDPYTYERCDSEAGLGGIWDNTQSGTTNGGTQGNTGNNGTPSTANSPNPPAPGGSG